MGSVPATEFKARCLELMDRVAERRETFVITKRGKPVAKLVPVERKAKESLFGRLREKATITGDIVSPTVPDAESEILREWDELNAPDEARGKPHRRKTPKGRASVTLVLLSSIPVLAAGAEPPAAASGSGDLWEVTSQMSMEGMPMALPAQKVKVCSAKVWTEAPGATDERRKCESSDFRMDGPKATWKVTCAGPPAMTGEGEITRDGDDAHSGAIKFTSSEGAMTIKLNGRRVGACDNPQ